MNSIKNSQLGEPVLTNDGSYSMLHHEHGECYHSNAGAFLEAQMLYVNASGFKDEISHRTVPLEVLDVGLGLAYNAIATISAWLDSNQACDLKITSLEINEDLIEALATGEAPWQKGWDERLLHMCKALSKDNGQWHSVIKASKADCICEWHILVGDALNFNLPKERFNYIWQDPFSPKKNPTMWSDLWFKKVFEASAFNATLMTYSVSRTVKDGLTAGGWQWSLIKGSGAKRHWLQAKKTSTI